MTKHTPGPWEQREAKTGFMSRLRLGFFLFQRSLTKDSAPIWITRKKESGEGAWLIAIVTRHKSTADQDEANADLITPAPELLEALKKAETLLNHMGDILNGLDAVTAEDAAMAAPIFEAVRAAIIKAEGTGK